MVLVTLPADEETRRENAISPTSRARSARTTPIGVAFTALAPALRRGVTSNRNMYNGDTSGTGIYSAAQFKIVAAHEYGHILGIADGYNNNTYKYYNSIMCDQWSQYNGTGKASSLDIKKAVNAYKTKKWQKWS